MEPSFGRVRFRVRKLRLSRDCDHSQMRQQPDINHINHISGRPDWFLWRRCSHRSARLCAVATITEHLLHLAVDYTGLCYGSLALPDRHRRIHGIHG